MWCSYRHILSIYHIFIYNKCEFNVDLYWIIKNVIIYCKYTLKFSVFEVIYIIYIIYYIYYTYYIILYISNIYYNFLPIHFSFLTYKGHMRDATSLKILVSAIDLWACQLTLLDSIRGLFRTQWSLYDEFLSRK